MLCSLVVNFYWNLARMKSNDIRKGYLTKVPVGHDLFPKCWEIIFHGQGISERRGLVAGLVEHKLTELGNKNSLVCGTGTSEDPGGLLVSTQPGIICWQDSQKLNVCDTPRLRRRALSFPDSSDLSQASVVWWLVVEIKRGYHGVVSDNY